jgi:hypothetical protein
MCRGMIMTEETDWIYSRADLIAHVKKSGDLWKASIGMLKPIGAGFSKTFASREEAIHFVSDYFRRKFGVK